MVSAQVAVHQLAQLSHPSNQEFRGQSHTTPQAQKLFLTLSHVNPFAACHTPLLTLTMGPAAAGAILKLNSIRYLQQRQQCHTYGKCATSTTAVWVCHQQQPHTAVLLCTAPQLSPRCAVLTCLLQLHPTPVLPHRALLDNVFAVSPQQRYSRSATTHAHTQSASNKTSDMHPGTGLPCCCCCCPPPQGNSQ